MQRPHHPRTRPGGRQLRSCAGSRRQVPASLDLHVRARLMPWPGTFPFGRASTERPPRTPPGPASAFVLGVYASALHVRWTPPAWHAGDSPKPVSALAVDVEPVVFWDGTDPDPSELIDQWKAAVGFVEGDDRGCDGHVAGVHLN